MTIYVQPNKLQQTTWWIIKIGDLYVDGVQIRPDCRVYVTKKLKSAWVSDTRREARDTIRSIFPYKLRKGMKPVKVTAIVHEAKKPNPFEYCPICKQKARGRLELHFSAKNGAICNCEKGRTDG